MNGGALIVAVLRNRRANRTT